VLQPVPFGDDYDAVVGDGQAALTVEFDVVADFHAGRDFDTFVDDGAANLGVTADIDALEEDGVFDMRIAVDAMGGDHAPAHPVDGAVAAARLLTLPHSVWEGDEILFMKGIEHFDPLHHQPHPPGYPLLIGLGKLLNLLFHDPFASLVALSVLAKLDPSSEVRISATWFIEMLNSLSWSDRNRALWALQTLTDSRDPMVLDQLRTRAMDALIDMARWKTLSHALPAFILLGRVAGMPEPEIQAAWTRGDRDSVISAAKKKSR